MFRDDVGLAPGDGRQDQAVNAPAEESGHQGPLPLGVVVEAGGKDGDPAGRQSVFQGPVDLTAERVGHAGQQQSDRERLPAGAPETPCRHVELVVELLGRVQHALAGGFGHPRLVVHHAGNRLYAHSRNAATWRIVGRFSRGPFGND